MKIGIDLGGSHIAVGLVESSGNILSKKEVQIPTVGGADSLDTVIMNVSEEEILTLMNTRRQKRIDSQPLEYPSAGSVFRNPSDTIFSGKLIEDLGLKGFSIGGAKVSEKHANFIVNLGHATGKDVRNLIKLIKDKVRESYHIDLILEQELLEWM